MQNNTALEYNLLSSIDYKELSFWDVKSYLGILMQSNFDVVKLGKYIKHQNNKIKPNNFPEQNFEILGVNNKTGLFDAYIQKGQEINQPYKIVEDGFLAYNPYRINVGSIGLKLPEHKYKYISPAYVVFSCKTDLLPEYLFSMFKTERFNTIINENTTGSVRQNLSYSRLSQIEIPLPPIEEQQNLVFTYQKKLNQVEKLEKESADLEEQIEEYLLEVLGIEYPKKKRFEIGKLNFVEFKKPEQWGVSINKLQVKAENAFESSKYPNKPISDFFLVNPITLIPKNEEISFIPMANVSDENGEIAKTEDKKLKSGYTRFKERDIIWARITPCMENGKSAFAINLKNGFGFGSTEFHVLRELNSKFHPQILHRLLGTKYLRDIAKNYFTGSAGQQRVPKSFLEKLTLPYIENVELQISIVNQIESMQTEKKNKREQAQKLKKQALLDFENTIFKPTE